MNAKKKEEEEDQEKKRRREGRIFGACINSISLSLSLFPADQPASQKLKALSFFLSLSFLPSTFFCLASSYHVEGKGKGLLLLPPFSISASERTGY